MRKLLTLLAIASVIAGLGATLAIARSKSVTINDNSFSTGSVSIKKGGSVTWHWSGTHNRHNVTAIKGGSFHSRTQKKGSYSHTFTRKGTYTLICTIHSRVMRMTVKVL
jgi:plastocyanin